MSDSRKPSRSRARSIERKSIDASGGVGEYWTAGSGPALLAFHGVVGGAETLRWFIDAFSSEFRVIVPSLGAASDPARVCDTAAEILAAEGYANASLFGISIGGLLAQWFVARFPERVERVALISSGEPRRIRELLYQALRLGTRLVPLRLVQGCVRLFLNGPLTPETPARGASRLARRALRDRRVRLRQYALSLNKEFVLARLRLTGALHRRSADIRAGLRRWQGSVLLLLADDDPTMSPRARRRINSHFPRLTLHSFPNGGHMIPLYHADEMRRLILSFMRGEVADVVTDADEVMKSEL